MAALDSNKKLREYCLRKLGKPAINIEVTEEQADDRIEDTIQKFVDRHYDGVEESYYKSSIKEKDVMNAYVTLPEEIVAVTQALESSTTSTEILNNFEYHLMDFYHRSGRFKNLDLVDYYLTRANLETIDNLLHPYRSYRYNKVTNKFFPEFEFTSVGSQNLLEDITDIEAVSWTAVDATLTSKDAELANTKLEAHTITSDTIGDFGLTQTWETKFYPRGLYTLRVNLKSGTYTGKVKLIIKDSQDKIIGTKTVQPTNIWTKFYVEGTCGVNHDQNIKVEVVTTEATTAGETFLLYAPILYKNSSMFIRVYTAIDAFDDVDVYNDEFVKKYATQMIKQQWGSNLKKFKNVQLPGGVEMSGQEVYDEATGELERLDEVFSLQYELPVDFFVE